MENRSTHYGDISKWIEKVIDSCETYQQTFSARRLIWNFDRQLSKKDPEKYHRDFYYDIIKPLRYHLENKIYQLPKDN